MVKKVTIKLKIYRVAVSTHSPPRQEILGVYHYELVLTNLYIHRKITLPAIVSAIHVNPTIDARSFSTFQLSPLEKYPKHAIMIRLDMVSMYLIIVYAIDIYLDLTYMTTVYGVIMYLSVVRMMFMGVFFILGIFKGVTYRRSPSAFKGCPGCCLPEIPAGVAGLFPWYHSIYGENRCFLYRSMRFLCAYAIYNSAMRSVCLALCAIV